MSIPTVSKWINGNLIFTLSLFKLIIEFFFPFFFLPSKNIIHSMLCLSPNVTASLFSHRSFKKVLHKKLSKKKQKKVLISKFHTKSIDEKKVKKKRFFQLYANLL